jgi:CRISPR-associated protein Cas1
MTRLATLDDAWARVRSNAGCAGGDGETVEGFQRRAAKRLTLLARALETGSYRPRDLRVLHVAKRSGGTRPLAIPSVEDRIAQTACAGVLGPVLDPGFSEASFAYRPGRSVLAAVRAVERWRKRG